MRTPGPWGIEETKTKNASFPPRVDFYTVTSEHANNPNNAVADLIDNKQDAHLIATAPEMYGALNWLLHLAHGVSRGGEDCPVTDAEWEDAWVNAKAVIDKAREEE